MRKFFRCVTAIAAIGLAGVFSAHHQVTGTGQAWAGQTIPGQHSSIMRISESEHFPQSKKIHLGIGKSMLIELPRDVRDVVVSDPAIVDAVVQTSTRTYLIGKAVGQASAFLFDVDGEQLLMLDIIVERDASALSDMLNRLIPHARIKAEILNDTVILTGSVRNPADATKAAEIASRFVVPDQGKLDARYREKVVNLLSVEANEQVLVKVTIVEMERTVVKRLGMNWSNVNFGDSNIMGGTQNEFPLSSATGMNAFVTSAFGPSGDRSSCFTPGGAGIPGTIGGLGTGGAILPNNLAINGINCLSKTVEAFERHGLLHTLAEPTLTAISGETASFLAGGEFPIPVSDDDGRITIDWKPFGVGLSFTPLVLSEGRISMRISTEVSELSTEGAVVAGSITIQGLKVRRANTTVEMPSGGSLVLAGLISDDTRQNIDGLPGLKKLPILGTLFRSRDYIKNDTELVIIVTPVMVNPVARQRLSRPDEGFMPASDPKGIFLGHLNRVYGRRKELPMGGSYKGNVGFIVD